MSRSFVSGNMKHSFYRLVSLVFTYCSWYLSRDLVCADVIPAADEPFRFRAGSPDRCPQQTINRLEVLPGYGWDNLRNIEMADIIDPTYAECRVTADRKLLIPDQVQVHALKNSDVKIFSEVIVNTTDYKSLDSTSINVHGGGGLKGEIILQI